MYKKLNIKYKFLMGIGDWGLGIGDWGLGPIPNPQSPSPHPQNPNPHPPSPLKIFFKNFSLFYSFIKIKKN